MVKICDFAKFYSNISFNYTVAKIKITKYNHAHQSCFVDISYCDLNIINLLRSISHDILCNESGGGGFTGFKNHYPHRQTLFFDEKWKTEQGEIGRRCLHFLHCWHLWSFSKIFELALFILDWEGGGG